MVYKNPDYWSDMILGTTLNKKYILHEEKIEFIILSPDCNPGTLKKTVRTIQEYFPQNQYCCVVSSEAKDIEEMKKVCPIKIGGRTITSLINEGIEKSKQEWVFILMAGVWLHANSLRKYELFLESDREILYPVVDRKIGFDEATINGILMSKKAFQSIGKFSDQNHSITLVKMIWAIDALALGFKFKALVGARLL